MSERTTSVSNNRPRPMVLPTCASTVNSLTAKDIMVKANTRPAEVTTDPLPPIARMMPVFKPAWISCLNRATRSRL